MIKISFIMRRLPSLSREAFQEYLLTKHPTCAPVESFTALGVKKYVQCHALDNEPVRKLVVGPRTVDDVYDAIADIYVEDEAVITKQWSTAEAKKYVDLFYQDEQNFIDWSNSTIVVAKEFVMME